MDPLLWLVILAIFLITRGSDGRSCDGLVCRWSTACGDCFSGMGADIMAADGYCF